MGLLILLLKIIILTTFWFYRLGCRTITIIMVFDSLEETWLRHLLIPVLRVFVVIWGSRKFVVALTDQRFTAVRAHIILTRIEKLILSVLIVLTKLNIILLFFRLFNLIRIAPFLDLITNASDSIGKYENEDKNVAESEKWCDIARHLEPTLFVHCRTEKRPNHLT